MRPQGSLRSPVIGQDSLEEAVDHADAAVLGSVVKTTFVGTGQLVTTFRVERVAKGPAVDEVTVNQGGTVESGNSKEGQLDWNLVEFGRGPDDIPIFVGDRAVLLLERQQGDTFSVQS